MTRDTESTLPITEQAAHWWVVLHSGGVSAAEHREFGEWVARSPERVEAYLRTAQLQQALKSPSIRWPDTPGEMLIRDAKAAPAETVQLTGGVSASEKDKQRRRTSFRTPFALGLAAVCVLSVGVAWLTLPRPQQFQTKFGEQHSLLLEDGSRVTLNTASKIEVDLQPQRRVIRLVRGEALFDVAHDPGRPFEVYAGNAALRAVGTQFDVDRRDDRTTVTVVEGLVAVISGNEGKPLTHLSVADRLVFTPAGPGELEHDTNVDAAISWTRRKLVFEDRPLGEVAEEFNRYNRERITIDSTELRQQRISGVFQSSDAASFVEFLAIIPGVQIRTDGHGGYIVTLDPATARQ